jgi:hypothetical protein
MLKISINILFASFEIGLGVKFTVKVKRQRAPLSSGDRALSQGKYKDAFKQCK